MTRTFALFLFLAACAVSACGAMDDTWEGTKHIAGSAWNSTKGLVNPDPDVDTNRYKFKNPNQEKLALLFTPVDGPVSALVRFVRDQDTYPSKEWKELLFARFPWIHGLIISDPDGIMLERIPPAPVKRINEPLRFESIWRETFLKTVVDYPELGPELYLGVPYFKDVEFLGLIVVSFDPRVLVSEFCPKPEQLILIHPGGAVWSQDPNADKQALLAVSWEKLLKDDVHGQVQVKDKYYTWFARYVGKDPYVYATESVDPAHSDSWFF